MTQVLVKEIMAREIKSISPDTVLPEAHQMMIRNNIRRLPVVDGDKLVGIVTLSDIQQASPSDATSLSVWELNYLLAKLTVKEIMTKSVVTIGEDDQVNKAANLMLSNKFGGIPVFSSAGVLVGMVTESDIFRLVAERGID
ncbi:MAG: CBS domain-containing protein [Gammaproteobacteria bacterium]|nr:CBS domain-containing protein [Gammaproteobacteria bacterium]MDH3447819.1 CBS domain-containing protein [Gammaproteobacteria bacterium]